MKNKLPLLIAVYVVSSTTQAQEFHPDAFGDRHNTATGWVHNVGQKLATDLEPARGLHAYTNGYGMQMWLLERSSFKLSKTVRDTVPFSNDTTFCVSITAAGQGASGVDPEPYLPLPGLLNFYYPHTGTAAEYVRSYHRWVYWNVWGSISMHFYTSRGGPKLAFVCPPGSDPATILLQLDGQDSLHVDINGELKMYIQGRWLELRQALAYQVNGSGQVVPVPWLPQYNEVGGVGLVNFIFGTYNPAWPLVVQIGGLELPAWEPTEPRNLGWSTYAGSDSGDEFMATGVDNDGDVYATGYTYEANFPVGTGFQVFPPFEPEHAGSEDVVTMKFAHENKQILWATYHGGSGQSTGQGDEWRGLDKAYDLAVYKGDETALEYVFITGATVNTDFFTIARSDTPFENADESPFTGGLTEQEHAAFLLAYRQSNGHLDWSTTIGPDQENIWSADGLGVDVLNDGTLVWSGRVSPVGAVGSFTYPLVTPSGAFTRPQGGGFFVLFNGAYQIEWNTFFGSTCGESGVFDVKVARAGNQNHRKAFLTGVTCPPNLPDYPGLDVYQPQGSSGFYQPNFGGGLRDAYFAVLNLDTYELEYSTHWGGNGSDFGIALEVVNSVPHGFKDVWVGGLSKSTNLTSTQLPPPGQGGLHQATNAGDADAMLLCFVTMPQVDLRYGTLYGGAGSDAILDLCAGVDDNSSFSAIQLYATGETGSASGIVQTQNPLLYQQDLIGNAPGSTALDGFLLALNTLDCSPIWTTYIGGYNTDKGWGVAAGHNELFLVGGSVSDQLSFPLKEFNVNSPLDWYDGDLFNNIGNGGSGEYSFSPGQNFYRPFNSTVLQYEPWPGWAHDAFIMSFGVSPALSVPETPEHAAVLRPILLDHEGLWSVELPTGNQWLRVHDASGRVLEERRSSATEGRQLIDLRQMAPGLYVLTCGNAEGLRLSAKLLRP